MQANNFCFFYFHFFSSSSSLVANNFVNSVLANVIIKIKENYINAMPCEYMRLSFLIHVKCPAGKFFTINIWNIVWRNWHISYWVSCFGCLLNNNRNESRRKRKEKSHVVTSVLSNPFKSQKNERRRRSEDICWILRERISSELGCLGDK